jgi:serine/threonine-protein kinase
VSGSERFEEQLVGQTIEGKYRLVEAVSGGCYGVVFRAEQYFCRQLVRPVAVKVTRQTGLTEESAPFLFSDALMLARLLASSEHAGRRHLVQMFDMGLLPQHDHRAYMVMEYVDGQPLLAHLQAAGRFSVATGLRFLEQVCRALAFIHSQGAVHRDIIPSNILVDRRGVVRLVDFGLAAFTDRQLGFVPGVEGLVFSYTAPETLEGRSTPASDVYSLGLVMYELFTGGGPHLHVRWVTDGDARSEENVRLKTGLRFAPPSLHQNEIRNDYRWLDSLILRCLEPDPARRFGNGAELLAAVEAGQSGLDLPEAPPAIPGEPRRAETPPAPTELSPDSEALFRDIRRLLAGRSYDQVIDRLDVHRPAEWAVLDLAGARTLRSLGQAYLGRGDLPAARECLEQLRSNQQRQALLTRADYAGALSDLVKCYRGLGLPDLAQACQEEARSLL